MQVELPLGLLEQVPLEQVLSEQMLSEQPELARVLWLLAVMLQALWLLEPIHQPTVPWPVPRQAQPRSPRSNQWSRPQEPCCPRASAQLRGNPH